MLKLLPNHFKKIGLFVAPLGLLLWVAMQKGLISDITLYFGLSNSTPLNIITAIVGLLSFLFGIYAMAFSKEKIEDEMIKNIRLESFRTAALIQIILITTGLILVGLMKEPPKDAGMMLFFIAAIIIFWFTYIIRFNYIVHFRIFKNDK
ncbi:hypothetical protein [Gaetbulibacter aestuarii]|uniref:DUF2178 domain-containing protein n=1 Tax=Gaetbulibacter aestuarii TaxID=1502358 RepID=A0ABW7N2R1_9FLAO